MFGLIGGVLLIEGIIIVGLIAAFYISELVRRKK